MPDTENCGRIPRKIPKTWSVEVVVGGLKFHFVGLVSRKYFWNCFNMVMNMFVDMFSKED